MLDQRSRSPLTVTCGIDFGDDQGQIWTTDRGGAARRWGEIEPNRAREMAMLRAWADDDRAATAEDLAQALASDGVVANVVDRLTAVAGLWS